MAGEFKFDVFLSHSTKDKAIVRPIAERLSKIDLLAVSCDLWAWALVFPSLLPRVLERVFASGWLRLASHTFCFCSPHGRARRCDLLQLDDSVIHGALTRFLRIDRQS